MYRGLSHVGPEQSVFQSRYKLRVLVQLHVNGQCGSTEIESIGEFAPLVTLCTLSNITVRSLLLVNRSKSCRFDQRT